MELIKGYSDVYYIEAPETATYPYAVFEVRKTVVRDGIANYNLEINVWDKYKSWSRCETIADRIENALDREVIMTDTFNGRLYDGYKQHVDDPDKQIKRIQVTMDMIIAERK